MKLLLLDDDPLVAAGLVRQLRGRVKVSVTSSVNEALQLLETQSFDVVLSDQNLDRGLTGLDFFQLLSVRFPRIRRVLMSGGEVERWFGIAHALISKPVLQDDLLAALLPQARQDVARPGA